MPFSFFYLGVGAAVLCCHFSVHLIFNYTSMEVVPPVGMLVYTAVYTLAGDGDVGRSRVRNPAPRYLISRFMFSFLCATHTRYACIQQCTGLILMVM